jgi:hypothetical protein
MVDLVKLFIIMRLFEAVSIDYYTFVVIDVRLARLC